MRKKETDFQTDKKPPPRLVILGSNGSNTFFLPRAARISTIFFCGIFPIFSFSQVVIYYTKKIVAKTKCCI